MPWLLACLRLSLDRDHRHLGLDAALLPQPCIAPTGWRPGRQAGRQKGQSEGSRYRCTPAQRQHPLGSSTAGQRQHKCGGVRRWVGSSSRPHQPTPCTPACPCRRRTCVDVCAPHRDLDRALGIVVEVAGGAAQLQSGRQAGRQAGSAHKASGNARSLGQGSTSADLLRSVAAAASLLPLTHCAHTLHTHKVHACRLMESPPSPPPAWSHLQHACAAGSDVACQHGGGDVLQLAVPAHAQRSHAAGGAEGERG